MDAVVQRVEALPGRGRYAVTFRRPDGSEQTATAILTDDRVEVAEAALPTGWRRDSPPWTAVAEAVVAFDSARQRSVPAVQLQDVAGGWDVSLGNVVAGADGDPVCTAHGPLTRTGDHFVCAECGAQAMLG